MAFRGLQIPFKARKKGLKNDDILKIREQTQAKGLVFMDKYASKNV